MKNDEKIAGAIFPVMIKNLNLLKKKAAPVYVKYIAKVGSKRSTKLQKGHYLLFYLSKANKSIVAYAKIRSVSFANPSEVKKNIDRIQMDEKEFSNYIKNREEKPLMFLELEKVVPLPEPVLIDYPITMTGRYISTKDIIHLIKISKY